MNDALAHHRDMANATNSKATEEEIKMYADAIFAELPEEEARELVLSALAMNDDPRSAHELSVEFGASEEAIRGIQHW